MPAAVAANGLRRWQVAQAARPRAPRRGRFAPTPMPDGARPGRLARLDSPAGRHGFRTGLARAGKRRMPARTSRVQTIAGDDRGRRLHAAGFFLTASISSRTFQPIPCARRCPRDHPSQGGGDDCLSLRLIDGQPCDFKAVRAQAVNELLWNERPCRGSTYPPKTRQDPPGWRPARAQIKGLDELSLSY